MEYNYHEAMKLANQLCFPLYAAARHVVNLYTPYLNPTTDASPIPATSARTGSATAPATAIR